MINPTQFDISKVVRFRHPAGFTVDVELVALGIGETLVREIGDAFRTSYWAFNHNLDWIDNAGQQITFTIEEPKPQPETTIMNLSTAVLLMNDKCRVIEAIYEPDGAGPNKDHPETYEAPRELFKTFDEAIKVGDILIVPSGTRHCITTVKVTDVDVEWDPGTTKDIKWIVGVVDMAHFEELKAMDDRMFATIKQAEKTSKRNELRKKLTEHMDEAQRAELAKLSDIGSIEHKPADPSV